LALVGKVFDPGQLARQRFLIEAPGAGQAGAAGTETIEQLRDDQFGTVAVGGARARIDAGRDARSRTDNTSFDFIRPRSESDGI
jgi:hypothetical protein